jgi:hypothetical protein
MKPYSFLFSILFGKIFILLSFTAESQTLIPYGSTWKYLDNNTRPANWETSGYNDGSWASGPSELGYGDAPVTTVSFGPDANNKYITTYFRISVNIANPAIYSDFTLNVRRDDGIVVYINGTERYANNMPAGRLHSTLASSAAADDGATPQTTTLSSSFFTTGTNVIAVEVHQSAANSSDLTFDLELIGNITPANIIGYGGSWKYLDNNTRPANWQTSGYNDASWASGNAELGYGDGGEATVVSFGPNSSNKYITTYFRRVVNITNLNTYANLTFNIIRDDGFVLYVNGTEVYRNNMPSGAVGHSTLANVTVGGSNETTPVSFSICPSAFVEGNNTIAVEMHQDAVTSSDISFNLELVGNILSAGTPLITRSPYLQMGRQTAITIRWRTDIPCFGRVQVGPSLGNYSTATVDETCATTEHELTVTGLSPDTKYFYSVGTASASLQATSSNFFTTLPPANTTRKLRFAVFGDCGRNDNSFQTQTLAQYQSYLSANGIDAADGMLLLGDNAYSSGTEAEYNTNFFGVYGGNILRNHKLYPAPGNHDYYGTSTTSRSGAYYLNFTMPTNGEIGGVPSGTEAYYSYDIGDIHFMSLDSYGQEADATKLYDTLGAQVTWIKADLAATDKKWVIAYWHHPPYTMGSHNSDSETDLRDIRERFIRILERNGVDIILCGHSHDYERSYLLKGYYKANPADPVVNEVNFNINTHTASSSSGRYNGTANSCPYTYTSGKNHHGTVYVLSGSAGADGSIQSGYPHNALPFSQDDGGMFYFEVDNNRLDAKFIRRDGVIADQFTILKDVNLTTNLTVTNGTSVNLSASWPGNYNWSTSATSRSVSITPPNNTTTNYTVTDNYGCITDQFNITASNTLPVSLLAFDAKLVDGKTELNWTTGGETNNQFFTIERSADSRSFSVIGTVNGSGTTTDSKNYAFTDLMPLPGISYYRLLQTDIDDRVQYLGIRRINNLEVKDFSVKVLSGYPGQMVLQLSTTDKGLYNINVFDVAGQLRMSRQIAVNAGITRKDFSLSAGVYVLEVRSSDGDVITDKVIIR